MRKTDNTGKRPTLKQLSSKHKPIKQYLRLFRDRYEQLFESMRDDTVTILEIGVGGYQDSNRGGGSLKMWADYFINGRIVAIDINDKNLELPNNAFFRQGSQTDLNFLAEVVKEFGPFDIVIDDASHVTAWTIESFKALWPHTKKYYIVEDLHMKSAIGTEEYFRSVRGADLETKNLCIVKR